MQPVHPPPDDAMGDYVLDNDPTQNGSDCSRCPPATEGSRNLVVCIDGTSNQFGINVRAWGVVHAAFSAFFLGSDLSLPQRTPTSLNCTVS